MKVTAKQLFCCVLLAAGSTLAVEVNDTQTWDDLTDLSEQTTTIGPNGDLTINGRVNLDNGTIILNGGRLTINGDFHFADTSADSNPEHIYLNAGTITVTYTESYRDRGAVVFVGAGEMTTGRVGNGEQYDPSDTSYWDIRAIEGYGPVQIDDVEGDRKKIWAPPLNPDMEFEAADSSGLESTSSAEIAVVLNRPEPDRTYTVDYAITGGTATRGADYVPVSACSCDFDGSGQFNFRDLSVFVDNWLSQTPGNAADITGDNNINFEDFAVCALDWLNTCGSNTLVFEPGQTRKTISIDIIDDGVDEGDETIELTLQSPTGQDATLGPKSRHTYTIVELQPSVGFEAPTDRDAEHIGVAAVEVSLTHLWRETVTVRYAVTGGTATAGADYNLSDGALTFDPGQTTKTIELSIVDDTSVEDAETVVITLSDPTNATLGTNTEHTYTIVDNESGLVWDGLVWYYSNVSGGPFVNASGDLEWDPEKGGQFITRIPDHRLSQVGDMVEFSFMWMTDGDHNCPPDSCTVCDRCSGDITCIAGTSDFRVGLFEADGEYVEEDGLGVFGSLFEGYKGYNFRFGPNMDPDIPPRWVDCDGEVHKTGNFCKKPEREDNLMTYNRGEMAYIPGFGLTPGEYSLFRVQLKRTSAKSVRMEIELNGVTLSDTDDSGREQPQKIDVFAVHMRNGREYNRLVLRKP